MAEIDLWSTVWTPIILPNSVGVLLDRDFAEKCRTFSFEGQPTLSQIIEGMWKLMGNQPPVTPTNFLDIREGILLQGIYASREGLWLTLDKGTPFGEKRALRYGAHNADRSAADRLWLLQAFYAWAHGATILLQDK